MFVGYSLHSLPVVEKRNCVAAKTRALPDTHSHLDKLNPGRYNTLHVQRGLSSHKSPHSEQIHRTSAHQMKPLCT